MLVSVSMNVQSAKAAATQEEMVDQLKAGGTIRSPRVESAMRAVDRQHYARLPDGTVRSPDAEPLPSPYAHGPFPIGQLSTISSPYAHAIALEALEAHLTRPGMTVLDVGSGSGYLTACLAQLVAHPPPGPAVSTTTDGQQQSSGVGVGHVTALEHSSVLLDQSKRNIARDQEIDVAGLISFVQSDALDPKAPWCAPAPAADGPAPSEYDVIHVGIAYPTLPVHLMRRLKVGGHMLVPVGRPGQQKLMLYEKLQPESGKSATNMKEGEGFTSRSIMACSYASVSMRAPPADVDHISSILREREKVHLALGECRRTLVEWQAEFARAHQGRKPTAADMKADPKAADLLAQVAPLVRQKAGYDRIVERYEKQKPTNDAAATCTAAAEPAA